MPLHPAYGKQMLDWMLGGASVTRPTQRWLSFATASPTSQSAFDGPYTPRCTVTFGAANSPAGTASNNNVISATLTAASGTPIGWNLWDASSSGTRIAYGTFSNAGGARTAGSTCGLAAGLLVINLT